MTINYDSFKGIYFAEYYSVQNWESNNKQSAYATFYKRYNY